MRTIGFTVPSRKRRRARLQRSTHVTSAVDALRTPALTQLLVDNHLVKPGSTAPERMLRDIARGVFLEDH